jgi:hypothetical protein
MTARMFITASVAVMLAAAAQTMFTMLAVA